MSHNLNLRAHAAREHAHMLECGIAYFAGEFPERFELLKALPFSDGVSVIREHYHEMAQLDDTESEQ